MESLPETYRAFFEPGDVTIRVQVWGAVGNPGLYELPAGAHLSTLYTLAGGPQLATVDDRSVRTTTLRLLRGSGAGDVVFRHTMENGITLPVEDPVLQEGDLLIVENSVRPRFTWREGITYFSVAASAASLILNIIEFTRN